MLATTKLRRLHFSLRSNTNYDFLQNGTEDSRQPRSETMTPLFLSGKALWKKKTCQRTAKQQATVRILRTSEATSATKATSTTSTTTATSTTKATITSTATTNEKTTTKASSTTANATMANSSAEMSALGWATCQETRPSSTCHQSR